MSDNPDPANYLFLFIFAVFMLPIGVFMGLDHLHLATFEECDADQVKVYTGIGNDCIPYEENLEKVLKGMNKIDLPASKRTIAQVTPGLSESEVEALLDKYQEQTGNVYTEFDNGVEEYNLVKNRGGAE